MTTRKTIVYRAVNAVNGKKYIGVTFNFDRRRQGHFNRARSPNRRQTKFTNAIRKHGENSFEFTIVSVWENRNLALQEEIRLIAVERPEYNITKGGDGINIFDRSIYPDWYKKVSSSLNGRKPSSEAARRWKEMAHVYAKKTVVCLNDGFFGKVGLVAKKYGISKHSVYSICSGAWFATGGLFFINSEIPLSDGKRMELMADKIEERKRHIEMKYVSKRREIIRLSDNHRYGSVTVAAKENGISQMRIVQICQGGGATRSGELFMYADHQEPPKSIRKTHDQLLDAKNKRVVALAKGRATQSKPVICVDSGRTFSSVSDAAIACGKSSTEVSAAISRSGRAGGMKFQYIEAGI